MRPRSRASRNRISEAWTGQEPHQSRPQHACFVSAGPAARYPIRASLIAHVTASRDEVVCPNPGESGELGGLVAAWRNRSHRRTHRSPEHLHTDRPRAGLPQIANELAAICRFFTGLDVVRAKQHVGINLFSILKLIDPVDCSIWLNISLT